MTWSLFLHYLTERGPSRLQPNERLKLTNQVGWVRIETTQDHHLIRMRTLPLPNAGDAGSRTAHRAFPVGGLFCVEFVVDAARYEA